MGVAAGIISNGLAPAQTNNSGSAGNGEVASLLNRADEVEDLIDAVKSLIIPFIRAADSSAPERAAGGGFATTPGPDPSSTRTGTALVDPVRPEALVERLRFSLPEGDGRGKDGLLDTIRDVLRYSVNTWDQGFLDKLYSSTNAVGVVHVYAVAPTLTVIEKTTARQLARMFGFAGPRAGGVVCQGGSGSNLTSLVVARNTLYPETKAGGNAGHRFALFTSEHGHYSVEKAAITCGRLTKRKTPVGSSAVIAIPVDGAGRMSAAALRAAVARARSEGRTPLYVNATAGTTVLGSFDPFDAIADVCRDEGLWMHVDGSWGGAAVFSARQRGLGKLAGAARADSLTVNPHKMLGVPVTCSFLLTPDLAVFHRANTLPAGYLFHGGGGDDDEKEGNGDSGSAERDQMEEKEEEEGEEVWDLADLTLQCGRRGDGLKLALAWVFYGAAGFEAQVDGAFETAAYLAQLVEAAPDFALLSSNPPPCLQVCFYYAPPGKGGANGNIEVDTAENTRRTRAMAARLVRRGFMIDYAPGEKGSFFRVVVNVQTLRGTVEGLLEALREVGREVVRE
ncbi:Glutamate decarboxylase 2 [Diatrype stigma]|uniref:Glutamate decarboxylase 2 n=1 Tax=Diatrype stigma TaxID=117547 RepID=A0AAN9YF51_9PEZI